MGSLFSSCVCVEGASGNYIMTKHTFCGAISIGAWGCEGGVRGQSVTGVASCHHRQRHTYTQAEVDISVRPGERSCAISSPHVQRQRQLILMNSSVLLRKTARPEKRWQCLFRKDGSCTCPRYVTLPNCWRGEMNFKRQVATATHRAAFVLPRPCRSSSYERGAAKNN